MWDEEQQCNFMGRMGKSEQRKLRNHVMEMVLATDMKQHFAIVGRFKTLITSAHSPHSPQGAFLHHLSSYPTVLFGMHHAHVGIALWLHDYVGSLDGREERAEYLMGASQT